MAGLTARDGVESEAVKRLASGIEAPAMREILERCLEGELSPAVAVMQMLIETEDAAAVQSAIDNITARAANLSRSNDSLLRDRVDELTQLVVDNATGCDRIVEMLRSNMDSPSQARSVDDGIAFCERLFDWSVQQSEEASVALYSLGSPELLERATQEITSYLESAGVIAADRVILDIGCGIGRLAVALAPRVREVHGIDVSAQMIGAAERRCLPFSNVRLIKGDGRNLGLYDDAMFDAAIAVDTFPYLYQSGMMLVSDHFAEVARVVKPGGDFVILNFSYRGLDDADRSDVSRLAEENGFSVICGGERPFMMWNGLAFRLRRLG